MTIASVTLPYSFDTRRETRLVLQGVLGLLAVLLSGGAYVLVVRQDGAAALAALLCGALLAVFGGLVLRHLPGAEGCITADAVVARAGRVFGLALPGPVGTFPLREFSAVRVEHVFGPTMTSQRPGWREHVTLVGRPGTPAVPVLRAPLARGAPTGEALAAALGLPCVIEGAASRSTHH